MKTIFMFSIIVAANLFSSAAFSRDFCKDILVDGAMKRTSLRSHSFFHQILAAEYSQKTDQEIEQQLSHEGSMTWAGVVFGGTFNKNDVKRYLQEVRSKLDITTVMSHQSSVLLATGDPTIAKAWSDCMQQLRGLSMAFEAKSPTSALLSIEWYAYPVAQGVSTDTKLLDDISIPPEVTVIAGKECLTAGRPLRDRVACTVNLRFQSGVRDLLLVANTTHGTASAYLPPRRILVAERESWKPQAGEETTVQVYTFEHAARSRSVCLSPKKEWSFVEATMEAKPQYISGRSESSRCVGEIKPITPTYLCFNSFMAPTAKSDNRCNATLQGEIIRWNAVDGLGLAHGARVENFQNLQ